MTKSQSTYAEYISRINRVIDYIRMNLDKQITVQELARVACFSEYHFHRIFSLIVGESINGYVRRMRLESAARALVNNISTPVTEIAMQLGFSSSANFAKAFKAYFNLSPSEFRTDMNEVRIKKSRNGKAKSKNGKAKEKIDMDYIYRIARLPEIDSLGIEIRELPALHLAYVRTLQGYKIEPIKQAWEKLTNWAQSRGLLHDGTIALGIEHDDPVLSGEENCRYDACITVPKEIQEFQGEIGIQGLPGGIYVVNNFIMENEIEIAMAKAYSQVFHWILENGFSPSNSPCYSLYLNPEEMKEDKPAKIAICVKVDPLYSNKS